MVDAMDDSLQQAILHAAHHHRSRPAVSVAGARPLTYGRLQRRGFAAARTLARHRECLETPVFLCLAKGPDLVSHILGVLLAGGTYVACEPSTADDGWPDLLRSLRVRLLIGVGPAPPWVASLPRPTWLDISRWSFRLPRPGLLDNRGRTGGGAMVRTSGTTGLPRGVLLESRSMWHHAASMADEERIDFHSRLSWLASPGVAAAQSHLFAALLRGACLCPFEPALYGLGDLTDWLRQERVTHLHATPSLIRAWLRSLPVAAPFPDLECIKLGGEPAHAADIQLMQRHLATMPRVVNGLGMSEASGNIACGEVTAADAAVGGMLPVGPPVPGRVVAIEDDGGREVDRGATGEIVVRDPWVAAGYCPAWPEGRITSDGSTRVLRTGDVGRWDSQGRLVHLGRLDSRIRVRGMTVDLADVEARMASLPAVDQVAAVPEEGRDGYRIAVVLERDSPSARQSLVRLLQTVLPVPPRRIGFFADLPVTAQGKQNAAEMLRVWPTPAPSVGWNRTEETIRGIWTNALGHDCFGLDDPFLQVGGDSLAIMSLAADLSRVAGCIVDVAEVIRLETVRAQARCLDSGDLKAGAHVGDTSVDFRIEWVRVRGRSVHGSIACLPGGWTTDNEMWIGAALLRELEPERLCLVARTNLLDPQARGPQSLDEAAMQLLPTLLNLDRPTLVGNCVGCPLALTLASHLTDAGHENLRILLLDPRIPGRTSAHTRLPPNISQYYKTLEADEQPRRIGDVDIILAADDPRYEQQQAYWSTWVGDPTRVHSSPGDHLTFIRQHRDRLARLVARLLVAR
jgi:acyl-CoA synthetase (AMP-forming)/AMP-acid ligase II/thioesterase domain-containing protein